MTGAHGGLAFFAYSTNYLIDLDHAVIVDVEASTAIRHAEVTAAKTMIERTEERFALHPERLAADSAYGSAEMLNWLVNDRRIEPHVPVLNKSQRIDGTFSREAFTYNQVSDTYVCPGGKTLATTGTPVNDGATLLYRASKHDCDSCGLKARCCPNTSARKVPRSIYEHARDLARSIAKTELYQTSRRLRKKIEMLFAHLKRILRLPAQATRTMRRKSLPSRVSAPLQCTSSCGYAETRYRRPALAETRPARSRSRVKPFRSLRRWPAGRREQTLCGP